jgi:hypothetical protein
VEGEEEKRVREDVDGCGIAGKRGRGGAVYDDGLIVEDELDRTSMYFPRRKRKAFNTPVAEDRDASSTRFRSLNPNEMTPLITNVLTVHAQIMKSLHFHSP